MVIDKNPMLHIQELHESYNVRENTIKPPDIYLGADIKLVTINDGTKAWTIGFETYVKGAVKNVKARLQGDGYRFNSKLSSTKYSAKQPFLTTEYRPELDTLTKCNDEQTQFFQNIIDILRWLVELGRINIAYETSVLSSYNVSPQTGHLIQALHTIKYLDIHPTIELTFDPQEFIFTEPEEKETKEKKRAMSQLYVDAAEDLPTNAPQLLGCPVQINCFVYSDHTGDRITQRSHTDIIMYLNKAPISWYSKKQSTVESSTFGSKFVALRLAVEQIISLQHKSRILGVHYQLMGEPMCFVTTNLFLRTLL